MYSFKEILTDICREKEGTTNIQQSHVMIPQRGLPSFEALDHLEFPFPLTSSSDTNGSSDDNGSLSQAFNAQSIDIWIKSKKIKLPSRGNGQQLPSNLTGQKAKEPVKAEVRSPYSCRGHVYNTIQYNTMQCNAM